MHPRVSYSTDESSERILKDWKWEEKFQNYANVPEETRAEKKKDNTEIITFYDTLQCTNLQTAVQYSHK